jgi:ABC-type lipoprotein export system ATPase subunit
MAPENKLQRLSGGQTRALMIADIALIADAPVVLIDEVENAGIDKHRAIAALAGQGKIIITATHDPVLMLMHERRVVMTGGGMRTVLDVPDEEQNWLRHLSQLDEKLLTARDRLRMGHRLDKEVTA